MNQFKLALFFMLIAVVGWLGSAHPERVSASEPTHASQLFPTVGINGEICEFNTIRDAIDAASDGDTIFIGAGTYNERLGEVPISLTFLPSTIPTQTDGGCKTELTTATSFTVQIRGDGVDVAQGGLAHITNGASVTFRHMLFRNVTVASGASGPAVVERGGNIAVSDGATIILEDVNVFDGTATEDGGGIYASCASSSPCSIQLLENSNVYRNSAANNGGGIYLEQSLLHVSNANIGLTENASYFNEATNGGGVYADNSAVTLENNSKVQRNEANGDGAGLWIDRSDLVIRDSTLFDNKAIGGDGGGLWIRLRSDFDAPPVLSNVTIQDNVALNNGGGIFQASNFAGAEFAFTMSGGTLQDNTAVNGDGGGAHLYIPSRSTATFTDVMITGNTASVDGGGIYMGIDSFQVGTLTIRRGGILSNTATTGLGGGIRTLKGTVSLESTDINANLAKVEGGGIFASFGEVNCQNSDFDGNSFVDFGDVNSFGGGLFLDSINEATLTNCDFKNNSASDSGGAILADFTDRLTITNSTFSDNRADTPSNRAGGGGAISANRMLEAMTLTNVVMSRNKTLGRGGAIEVEGSDAVTLNDVEISFSEAEQGGGLWCRRSEVTMEDAEFRFNQAIDASTFDAGGGGLHLSNDCQTTVLRTTIESNSAEKGGGIYAIVDGYTDNFTSGDASLLLDDVTLDNNSAMAGGGVYLTGRDDTPGNTALIKNSEIINNDANEVADTIENDDGLGGGIFADSARLQLENVSIRDNEADFDGGAIYSEGATVHTSIDAATCSSTALPANRYCSEIIGNGAGNEGGAIFVRGIGDNASTSVQSIIGLGNTALISNEAPEGTAIYVEKSSFLGIQTTLMLTNVLAVTNQHPSFGGLGTLAAAIELHDDTVLIARSGTIANNFGKPLEVHDVVATINMLDSILYANSEGPLVPTGVVLGASCNISQPAASSGQTLGVFANPQFTFTSRGNFRLASGSPAVNACSGGPADDLDGFSRVDGSLDRGAFERDGVPLAVVVREQGTGVGERRTVLLFVAFGLVGVTVVRAASLKTRDGQIG